MLDKNIEACPVFTRWQIRCYKCKALFYIDSEPSWTEEEILGLELEDMDCEYHPTEGAVLELV